MSTASVVHYFFGEESYLVDLAQSVGIPLDAAIDGYDETVLLHDGKPMLQDRPTVTQGKATRAAFTRAISDLLARHDFVDVFVFSHGSPGGSFLSLGKSKGSPVAVTAGYLRDSLAEDVKTAQGKLRLVYQMHCFGNDLSPLWAELGAQVVLGSRGVNFYPTRWPGFAKRWSSGQEVGKAVRQSVTGLAEAPIKGWILFDAASKLKAWGGRAVDAVQVLGSGDPSKDYFAAVWPTVPWAESGLESMRASSETVIVGDPTTRA